MNVPWGTESVISRDDAARGTYRLFGLRIDLVHHLLTPHFFIWFVEWNELIYHHLIPYS
jgi:hypothetical protein